jgi:hypothetical protein
MNRIVFHLSNLFRLHIFQLFPAAGYWAPLGAASFPTLFSMASGVIGLVAGPSSALRSLDYRVRPLSPLSQWLRHRLADQAKTRL